MKQASTPKKSVPLQTFIHADPFNIKERKTLVLAPEAIGRLRREMIWTLGETRTHGLLARYGFSCGQADALNPLNEQTLIQGLGEIKKDETVPTTTDPAFEVKDSFEANEHLQFFSAPAKSPQCWILAGYLTGLLSHQLGHPIYFMETACVAKKDHRCRFIGRSKSDWLADESNPVDLSVYDEDNMALELASTREQLRLTKDKYQNLFEQSNMPVLIIDPDTGIYLNANMAAEDLTGYTREELLKMTLFDIRHPDEHNQAIGQLKQLVAQGYVDYEEIRIVRADGAVRTVARSNKILTYGGRRVIQSILRDITELKTAEQKEKDLQHQLVRSERLSSIGRLAAGVAHELKNPLGAIKNAVYYVRNALLNNPILESDPHLKEILKLAESEVDGAVVIIGELLDFSRVVQLVPRRTQINDLLEKIPNIVSLPSNVELVYDLDLTLPSASVDPDRLNQVFCNIVTNAIQAMTQGGKLTLKSRFVVEAAGEEGISAERIVVTIEDTGVGIEAVHLSKIFEPLFTTKARGTGLGLAISTNIVEKHGGVILVTSQVGKGTAFTVKLPLKAPADAEGSIYEHRKNSIG